MSAVNGVAALEGHHIFTIGETGTHFGGCLAGEDPLRQLQALDASTQIEALALHGDHPHGGVLDRSGAVAALGFRDLVGLPLRLHLENGQVLALVGEQHAVAHHHIVAIGVHHDRQTEQLTRCKPVTGDDSVVILLVHEAPQRGEAADHQQFHIAGIAIGALQGLGG